MDSDNEADDFFSTLSAHRSGSEHAHDVGDTSDYGEKDGEFSGQAQQIGKRAYLRPSRNPTHDRKYWGKKTSRSKMASENDTFGNEDKQFSDVDSEGFPDGGESEDEQDWVSDESDQESDRLPSKRRKISADQSDYSMSDADEGVDGSGNDTNKNQRTISSKAVKGADIGLSGAWEVSEKEKGVAVRKQLQLWEKCLKLRILIQKALHAANELPLPTSTSKTPSEDKEEVTEAVGRILHKVVDMCYESMKALPFDDDSVCCDTTNDDKSRLEEISSLLLAQGSELMQKWSDKIQLSTGRFSDKSSSFSGGANNRIPQQIQSILADRNRLLKRTRTKRVDYVMAVSDQGAVEEATAGEVYDEYDFYQNLVKDLINSKNCSSFEATDQLQSSDGGFKLKQVKSITTQLVRKNRNIVYDIHAKLVGFMAPEAEATDWKNEAIDALTLSVFRD